MFLHFPFQSPPFQTSLPLIYSVVTVGLDMKTVSHPTSSIDLCALKTSGPQTVLEAQETAAWFLSEYSLIKWVLLKGALLTLFFWSGRRCSEATVLRLAAVKEKATPNLGMIACLEAMVPAFSEVSSIPEWFMAMEETAKDSKGQIIGWGSEQEYLALPPQGRPKSAARYHMEPCDSMELCHTSAYFLKKFSCFPPI